MSASPASFQMSQRLKRISYHQAAVPQAPEGEALEAPRGAVPTEFHGQPADRGVPRSLNEPKKDRKRSKSMEKCMKKSRKSIEYLLRSPLKRLRDRLQATCCASHSPEPLQISTCKSPAASKSLLGCSRWLLGSTRLSMWLLSCGRRLSERPSF